MNFFDAANRKMGDGWAYTYEADKIRGFKQTHQPSPWIKDYGQFAIMPVTDSLCLMKINVPAGFRTSRNCKTYYYSVNLAEFDVLTEIVPTMRAAMLNLHFHRVINLL
jgi:putative alpha-1,2-mannosidase